MTSTWHFADRYYLAPGGPARRHRGKNYNSGQSKRRHPMVTKPFWSGTDYFRTSGARYFQWQEGRYSSYPYHNFGYISNCRGWPTTTFDRGDLDSAGEPTKHYVGYMITDPGDPTDGPDWITTGIKTLDNFTPPDLNARILHIFGATGMGDLLEPHVPVDPTTDIMAASVLREKVTITITANEEGWLAAADASLYGNVGPQYSQLGLGPPPLGDPEYGSDDLLTNWNMWQVYVLGSADPRLNETWYGERDVGNGGSLDVPGLFGPRTMDYGFFDHQFTKVKPSTNEVAQITPQYTYYNSNYEGASSAYGAFEALMPNHYLVMSLAKNGSDWAWPAPGASDASLYEGTLEVGGVLDDILSLYGNIGGVVTDETNDIFAQSGIPMGQIQAGSQTPDSLLSRFARTNFSALPASSNSTVINFNKHIGFSSRIIRGPNSPFQEMGGGTNTSLVPYGIELNLANLPQSEFLRIFEQGDDDYTNAMVDYFLYEIMKANIFNYTNPPQTGSNLERPGLMNPAYHHLPMSARETRPTFPGNDRGNFYGIDWTDENPAWADNSMAVAHADFSLRAINFNHLILQWLTHFGPNNIDEPPGTFAIEQVYNGLIGQTQQKFVADKTGFIVGRGLYDEPPGSNVNMNDYANVLSTDAEDDMTAALEDMGNYFVGKMRTFAEVYTGTPCRTDTIAYKVEKYAVDAAGVDIGEPLQSFYFPAVLGDVDADPAALNYFDSQVFYNKKYRYKVYSYDLVIGNQYNYKNAEVFPPVDTTPWPNNLALALLTRPADSPDLVTDVVFQGGGSPYGDTEGYLLGARRDSPSTNQQLSYIEVPDFGGSFTPAQDRSYFVDMYIDGHRYSREIPTSHPVNGRLYWDDQYWSDPLVQPMPEALENTLNSIIDDYFDDFYSPGGGFVNAAMSKYYSKFRVRSIIKGGGNQAQTLIAQVKRIRTPGQQSNTNMQWLANKVANTPSGFEPWPTDAAFDEVPGQILVDGAPGRTYYEMYFNLHSSAAELSGPSLWGTPEIVLQFRSGARGIAPSIPWQDQGAQAGTAQVDVNNFPSIQIVEVPYITTNATTVHDLPPMYPHVNFYPVRFKPNKIKILLNQNNFRYSAVPTVIQASDSQIFADIRESQGSVPGTPIVFGADDTEIQFQIFRIDGPAPETYSDFANKLLHTLDTRASNNQSVTAAAMIDNIQPNINYYYCFRTIDKGGWISNPTPVLRVQLVDDNGRMYPIIEPYDLELLNPLKTEKPFKKYLEIGASVAEQVVTAIPTADGEDAQSAGNPLTLATQAQVGPEGGILMSGGTKSVKIRITSKDTGKKMDLNVNFNVNQIANPNLVEEN